MGRHKGGPYNRPRRLPISQGMKILYFAWLRSRVGITEERVEPPAEGASVGALLGWLQSRGPRFAEALKALSIVRVAVNQEYVGGDRPVRQADEVAPFPPVT